MGQQFSSVKLPNGTAHANSGAVSASADDTKHTPDCPKYVSNNKKHNADYSKDNSFNSDCLKHNSLKYKRHNADCPKFKSEFTEHNTDCPKFNSESMKHTVDCLKYNSGCNKQSSSNLNSEYAAKHNSDCSKSHLDCDRHSLDCFELNSDGNRRGASCTKSDSNCNSDANCLNQNKNNAQCSKCDLNCNNENCASCVHCDEDLNEIDPDKNNSNLSSKSEDCKSHETDCPKHVSVCPKRPSARRKTSRAGISVCQCRHKSLDTLSCFSARSRVGAGRVCRRDACKQRRRMSGSRNESEDDLSPSVDPNEICCTCWKDENVNVNIVCTCCTCCKDGSSVDGGSSQRDEAGLSSSNAGDTSNNNQQGDVSGNIAAGSSSAACVKSSSIDRYMSALSDNRRRRLEQDKPHDPSKPPRRLWACSKKSGEDPGCEPAKRKRPAWVAKFCGQKNSNKASGESSQCVCTMYKNNSADEHRTETENIENTASTPPLQRQTLSLGFAADRDYQRSYLYNQQRAEANYNIQGNLFNININTLARLALGNVDSSTVYGSIREGSSRQGGVYGNIREGNSGQSGMYGSIREGSSGQGGDVYGTLRERSTTQQEEEAQRQQRSGRPGGNQVILVSVSTSNNPHLPRLSFARDSEEIPDALQDEGPSLDCEERARERRALEIVEGVEPPPGYRPNHIQTLSTSEIAALLFHEQQQLMMGQPPAPQPQQLRLVLEPAGRIHTQVDYIHCLVPDLRAITACGFYWGKMDRYEAERLLEARPEGTFLLRDSAQEEYLFSVSFRKYGRSLHARIEQFNHKFSFDSHDPGVYAAGTVTGLIEHYKDPACVMFFEPMLTAPLCRSFAFPLQVLCRAAIASSVSYDGIGRLRLPAQMKNYLKEYHYRQRVRVTRFDEQAHTPTTW